MFGRPYRASFIHGNSSFFVKSQSCEENENIYIIDFNKTWSQPAREYFWEFDHVSVWKVEGFKPWDCRLGEIPPTIISNWQSNLLLGEAQPQSKQTYLELFWRVKNNNELSFSS